MGKVLALGASGPTEIEAVTLAPFAGTTIPAYLSDSGEYWFVQNSLALHGIHMLQFHGFSATTNSLWGWPAWGVVGSTVAVAGATTDEWTQTPRMGYRPATLATIGGIYQPQRTKWYCAAANNFGHVTSYYFAVADVGGLYAGARLFVGDTTSVSAPTDVNPVGMPNILGLCQSPTLPNPNNLYFVVNGTSATGYTVDTGIELDINTGYKLTMVSNKGNRSIGFRLTDILTDTTFEAEIDLANLPAAQQPTVATAYSPRLWRSAGGAISSNPTLHVSRVYEEVKN